MAIITPNASPILSTIIAVTIAANATLTRLFASKIVNSSNVGFAVPILYYYVILGSKNKFVKRLS